jgi:pyridoxal phosphate enzyme (YggS family)
MTYPNLLSELAEYKAQLVAVSKTKPKEAIMDLYLKGQRIFGENRVQELAEKQPKLPADIEWHMIGHLQRNKVKYIASFVKLIHSVDNLKLLKEINKQALKHDRTIPILLQFHIAKETTKSGFSLLEVKEVLKDKSFKELKNIEIQGVMGMATFTTDLTLVRSEFSTLKSIFDHLKTANFSEQSSFHTISMGMSGDYKIALEEGANMVRIGSLLFGARN